MQMGWRNLLNIFMIVLRVLLADLSRRAVLRHERVVCVLQANSSAKLAVNPDERVILF
jgi:hypothetical protein